MRSSGRIDQRDVPANKSLSKEHPNQRTKREIWTKWQLCGPNAFPNQQRGQAHDRTENGTRENAKQNAAPAKKSANRSEKLQVPTPHRFTRDFEFARDT